MKILMSLDKAAKELNKKLIFVMDEFQQIATLEKSHSLEASIRHAVERSKNVFYIFSGSNRTLLEDMFRNKDRPLYQLCDDMKIHSIDKQHYQTFIKKASRKTWGSLISTECIDRILSLTECHPYYVNRLCRMLWDNDNLPSVDSIDAIWDQYVENQKISWASDIVSRLTVNQRAVLAGLARLPEKELRGKDFSNRLEISSSSIQRSITSLMKMDLVYKDLEGYYHVLNPVIKTALFKDKYFD